MSIKEKKELLTLLKKLDELFDNNHATTLGIDQVCNYVGMKKEKFVKMLLPLDQEKIVHLYGEPRNITQVDAAYGTLKIYIARLEDKIQELEYQEKQLAINKEQSHFNRIIALTGAIIAAVELMNFMVQQEIFTPKGKPVVWMVGIGCFIILLLVFSYLPKILK